MDLPLVFVVWHEFNYDFHVTLDQTITAPEYNYEPFDMNGEHWSRCRDSARSSVSATRCSTRTRVYTRGLETIGGSYYILDETPLGRQEDWEEPKGRADDAREPLCPDFAS